MEIFKNIQMLKAALGSLALAVVMAASVPAAMAQAARGATSIQPIDIPAGPLNRSLIAISNAFGLNVIASDDLVAGKTAPAVFGALSAEDALERALKGSGLVYTEVPDAKQPKLGVSH